MFENIDLFQFQRQRIKNYLKVIVGTKQFKEDLVSLFYSQLVSRLQLLWYYRFFPRTFLPTEARKRVVENCLHEYRDGY